MGVVKAIKFVTVCHSSHRTPTPVPSLRASRVIRVDWESIVALDSVPQEERRGPLIPPSAFRAHT